MQDMRTIATDDLVARASVCHATVSEKTAEIVEWTEVLLGVGTFGDSRNIVLDYFLFFFVTCNI